MSGNIQDKAQGATETVKNTLGMGVKEPTTGEKITKAAQGTGDTVNNAAQGATETVKNTLGMGGDTTTTTPIKKT
ncbi:late embryogenesis abundant protein Dc3 [Tanacetum coccineum]